MSILNKILLKIKSVNIVYIFLFTFLSFLIISNFYWTKYRPMIATKECEEVASKFMKEVKFNNSIKEFENAYDFVFARCLKARYGIN